MPPGIYTSILSAADGTRIPYSSTKQQESLTTADQQQESRQDCGENSGKSEEEDDDHSSVVYDFGGNTMWKHIVWELSAQSHQKRGCDAA